MAAARNIYVFHGAGSGIGYALNPTDSAGNPDAGYNASFVDTPGHLRFKLADDSNKNTASPVVVPPSGSNYSFEKRTKIKFTSAPPAEIVNLRWFNTPPGTVQTGAKINVKSDVSYTQGTSSPVPGMTDSAVYTNTNPLLLNAGTVISSAGFSPGFGNQPYVVCQIEVTSAAASGVTLDHGLSYRYDEF